MTKTNETLAYLNTVNNEVTRRMAEGQFKSAESSARAIVELETKFPEARFRRDFSGVHFNVNLDIAPPLASKVSRKL